MQALYKTVKDIIDSGRIGIPVFVRCLVQIPYEYEGESSKKVLTRIATVAGSWLNSKPSSIYAQHTDNLRHIEVTIKYEGGQTSIVAVSIVPDVNIQFDLMILGNKGGIYHDGDTMSSEIDIKAEPLSVPRWLTLAFDQSSREGKPVVVKEEKGSE
jgi:hypothetical protein